MSYIKSQSSTKHKSVLSKPSTSRAQPRDPHQMNVSTTQLPRSGDKRLIRVINSVQVEKIIDRSETGCILDRSKGLRYWKPIRNSEGKSDSNEHEPHIGSEGHDDFSDSNVIYSNEILSTLYDNYNDDEAYEENDVDDSVNPYQIWANGLTYECKACNTFCIKNQKEFIKHIKYEHGLSGLSNYRSEFGDPVSDLKTIDCMMCGGRIIHEFSKIYTHLYKLHKRTSVENYYENHVQYPGRGKVQEQEFLSLHLESHIQEAAGTVNDYKNWANKCRMECKHSGCVYATNQHQDFRMHVMSVHSQLFEEYCETFNVNSQSAWSSVVYVLCRLCCSEVPNSQESLDAHMVKSHRLSGLEYFKKHIQIQVCM